MSELLILIWMTASITALPGQIAQTSNHTGFHKSAGRFSEEEIDEKIVGGKFVQDIRDLPYMVAMMIDGEPDCGGGLLTLLFVITACHCVADVDPQKPGPAKRRDYMDIKEYTFVAGTVDLKKFEKTVQVRGAESVYFHPECRSIKSLVYDLGLAKMLVPFVQTPSVRPLKMFSWDTGTLTATIYDMFRGANQPICMVAGWGVTTRDKDDYSASDHLKAIEMHVISSEDCQKAYAEHIPSRFTNYNFTKYGQICTLSQNLNASDCAGDSGGPFVCNGYIIGVVSFGMDCGSADPNVYQTVSILPDWFQRRFPGETHDEDTDGPKPYNKGRISATAGGSAGQVSSGIIHQPQYRYQSLSLIIMYLKFLKPIVLSLQVPQNVFNSCVQ